MNLNRFWAIYFILPFFCPQVGLSQINEDSLSLQVIKNLEEEVNLQMKKVSSLRKENQKLRNDLEDERKQTSYYRKKFYECRTQLLESKSDTSNQYSTSLKKEIHRLNNKVATLQSINNHNVIKSNDDIINLINRVNKFIRNNRFYDNKKEIELYKFQLTIAKCYSDEYKESIEKLYKDLDTFMFICSVFAKSKQVLENEVDKEEVRYTIKVLNIVDVPEFNAHMDKERNFLKKELQEKIN